MNCYGGQPGVTLPFQAFLLVLIGFLYKTAQEPLKNRSNLAWETVQISPLEMSDFWAVFKQGLSGLSGFSKKKRPNRANRSNRSNLAEKPLKPLKSWAVLSGISTRVSTRWNLCPILHDEVVANPSIFCSDLNHCASLPNSSNCWTEKIVITQTILWRFYAFI